MGVGRGEGSKVSLALVFLVSSGTCYYLPVHLSVSI